MVIVLKVIRITNVSNHEKRVGKPRVVPGAM